jgi:hypothetical protein
MNDNHGTMTSMNDLPDPSKTTIPKATDAPGSAGTTPVDDPGMQFAPGVGLGVKEMEPVPSLLIPEQTGLVETHKDIELPPEVIKSGVRVQPTQVPLPQVVQTAGVQPAGINVTIGNGATIAMPLSDDQIAQGLKTSVAESWRWLAEWCLRQIKLMGAKKTVH